MSEGKIRGLKVGRRWRFERGEIERFLKGEAPRIVLGTDITPCLDILRAKGKECGAPKTDLPDGTELLQAVKLMVELGLALDASDFHISPHEEGSIIVLRYRIDGVLYEYARADSRLLGGLIEQWKLLAGLDPREVGPQDGRIKANVVDGNKPIDIRVSFLNSFYGWTLTGRIIKGDAQEFDVEKLGYSPRDREKLIQKIHAPRGLLVVTGPTGTGKTTTLYSCLNHLNGGNIKIMTVEDPIEVTFPWMIQVPVNEKEGITFAKVMRAFFRSAAEVMLLGEIRDSECAWMAHQGAMTGHLVFTTLHADDTARALVRMVEIGVSPFVVGDATLLVLSQRLVRTLCPECSARDSIAGPMLAQAEKVARTGGLDWATLPRDFRKPVGCRKCKNTGFLGRTVMAEVLEMTPEIGSALRRGAAADELRTLAVGQGMTTMGADGVRKAAEGKTTLEEVFRQLNILFT
jgi:type II secretory ATPase GspE/PulE/Tfp pilus assembly ATPase PilB-like protein